MNPQTRSAERPGRETWAASLALGACVLLSLFCLFYPVYVIRPFRHQGVNELMAALFVLRWRPIAMNQCVAVGLAALVWQWRSQRKLWRRVLVCLATAGVCLFAALSRINIYELMFHPMDRPAFQFAADAKLDTREKVIAINVGAVARAYPIRIISYHHIVNDVVGGVPIVATY